MERRDVLKLLAGGSMAALLPGRAAAFASSLELHPSRSVGFRCLGVQNPNLFLDGRTAEPIHANRVGLAPNRNPPFTGTEWRFHRLGNFTYQFECLGHIDGPRWLDGDTFDGTVVSLTTAI